GWAAAYVTALHPGNLHLPSDHRDELRQMLNGVPRRPRTPGGDPTAVAVNVALLPAIVDCDDVWAAPTVPTSRTPLGRRFRHALQTVSGHHRAHSADARARRVQQQ